MRIRIVFNGDRHVVEKRGFFCWEKVSDQGFIKIHDETYRIGYKSMGEAIGFVQKIFGKRAAEGIKTKFITVAEYQA